jgi:hypothetical protein
MEWFYPLVSNDQLQFLSTSSHMFGENDMLDWRKMHGQTNFQEALYILHYLEVNENRMPTSN